MRLLEDCTPTKSSNATLCYSTNYQVGHLKMSHLAGSRAATGSEASTNVVHSSLNAIYATNATTTSRTANLVLEHKTKAQH